MQVETIGITTRESTPEFQYYGLGVCRCCRRENIGKPGDKVEILAYGAKDGTRNLAIVRTITFESGDNVGVTFRLLRDFKK
jgi:hypothetical protein